MKNRKQESPAVNQPGPQGIDFAQLMQDPKVLNLLSAFKTLPPKGQMFDEESYSNFVLTLSSSVGSEVATGMPVYSDYVKNPDSIGPCLIKQLIPMALPQAEIKPAQDAFDELSTKRAAGQKVSVQDLLRIAGRVPSLGKVLPYLNVIRMFAGGSSPTRYVPVGGTRDHDKTQI